MAPAVEQDVDVPRRSWSRSLLIGLLEWGGVFCVHSVAFAIFVLNVVEEWDDESWEIVRNVYLAIFIGDALGWIATRCPPRSWTATRFMPAAVIWFTWGHVEIIAFVTYVQSDEVDVDPYLGYGIVFAWAVLWFVLGAPIVRVGFALYRCASRARSLKIVACVLLVAILGAGAYVGGDALADTLAEAGATLAVSVAAAAAAVSAAASTALSTSMSAGSVAANGVANGANGVANGVANGADTVKDLLGGEEGAERGEGEPGQKEAGDEGPEDKDGEEEDEKDRDKKKRSKRRRQRHQKKRAEQERRAPQPVVGRYVEVAAGGKEEGAQAKPAQLVIRPGGSGCLRACLGVFRCSSRRFRSCYQKVRNQTDGQAIVEVEEVDPSSGGSRKWWNQPEKTWICQESSRVVITGGVPPRPSRPVLFGTGDGLRASWDIQTTSLPVDTTVIEIRKCDTSTEWTGTITTIEVPASSDVFVIDAKVMPEFEFGHGYQVRVAGKSAMGRGPFSEVSAQASSYSDKQALQEAMRKVQSEGPIEFQATKTDLKGTVERQQIKAMAGAVMQEPFPGVILTGYARPQTQGKECIEDASAKAHQRALTVKTALIAEIKKQPKFDGTNLPPIKTESAAYDNQGLRVDARLVDAAILLEEQQSKEQAGAAWSDVDRDGAAVPIAAAVVEARPPLEEMPLNSIRREWVREPKNPRFQKLKSSIPVVVLTALAVMKLAKGQTSKAMSLFLAVFVALAMQRKFVREVPSVKRFFEIMDGPYTKLFIGLFPAVPAIFSGHATTIVIGITLVISSALNFVHLEHLSSLFLRATGLPLLLVAIIQWLGDDGSLAGTAVLLAALAVVKSVSDLLKIDELEVSEADLDTDKAEAKQKVAQQTGLSTDNIVSLLGETEEAHKVLHALTDQMVMRMCMVAKATFADAVSAKFGSLRGYVQKRVKEDTTHVVKALDIDHVAKKGDKLGEVACKALRPSVERLHRYLGKFFTDMVGPRVQECRDKVKTAQTVMEKFNTGLNATESLLGANLTTLLKSGPAGVMDYLNVQVNRGIDDIKQAVATKGRASPHGKPGAAMIARVERLRANIAFLRGMVANASASMPTLVQFYGSVGLARRGGLGTYAEKAVEALKAADARLSESEARIGEGQGVVSAGSYPKADEIMQKVMDDCAALLLPGGPGAAHEAGPQTPGELDALAEAMRTLSGEVGRLEERLKRGCKLCQPALEILEEFDVGPDQGDLADELTEAGESLGLDPEVAKTLVAMHGKAEQVACSARTAQAELQTKLDLADKWVTKAEAFVEKGEDLKGNAAKLIEMLEAEDVATAYVEDLRSNVEKTMVTQANVVIDEAEKLPFDVLDQMYDLMEQSLRQEVARLFGAEGAALPGGELPILLSAVPGVQAKEGVGEAGGGEAAEAGQPAAGRGEAGQLPEGGAPAAEGSRPGREPYSTPSDVDVPDRVVRPPPDVPPASDGSVDADAPVEEQAVGPVISERVEEVEGCAFLACPALRV